MRAAVPKGAAAFSLAVVEKIRQWFFGNKNFTLCNESF
jgi:hypothetical protein